MARPMQMYVYVHDAILREVAELEVRTRELDRGNPEEIAALAGHMAWFHEMIRTHEHAEEQVLFPAMHDRYRYVAEAYEFDHDDFEHHVFAGIDTALSGLRRADGDATRRQRSRDLYRECVALHEHMRLHISKENELLLPKLESEFDVSEQAEIAGAMAGIFDPPLMAETVGWMYRGQSLQDREGMLRFLMEILPTEAFAGITTRLAGMGSAEWAEMERRIPELMA